MSDQVRGTIELVQAEIRRLEQEIAEKKRSINNTLCPLAGLPPIYAEIDMEPTESVGIRSDEFYGRPLAEVVRKILEKRKQANLGAASVQEIYEAMKAGGFHFQAKNDDYAKRGLYQSLTKNSATFHKIPISGKYGLLDWYPGAKSAKAKDPAANGVAVEVNGEASATTEGAEVDGEHAEEKQAATPKKPR